jgi:hypothetical protein
LEIEGLNALLQFNKGVDTGLVTNSADRNVLKKHYIDPKIRTTIEIAALNVRVFGKK